MKTDIVISSPRRPREDDAGSDRQLRQFQVWEWFRWASVLLIGLLLAGGLFLLAFPVIQGESLVQRQLDISIWALFGLVLLFSAYTVYQQMVITDLRRYDSRVAMAASLELLKPPAELADPAYKNPRRYERFHFDRRITVEGIVDGERKTIYARSSDISEGGVGAMLPEALPAGAQATVALPLGPEGADISITAIVRHSRGFYHGFEFYSLCESHRAAIRKACQGGVPLRWYRR